MTISTIRKLYASPKATSGLSSTEVTECATAQGGSVAILSGRFFIYRLQAWVREAA